MGDYGIKIAKPTKNVSSTDPKDYIFWSKLQTLSLFAKITSAITLPATHTSVSVAVTHNLGYRPHVWVFANDCGNRYSRLPYRNYLCTDCDLKTENPYFNFTYKVTTTQVILEITAFCENFSSHTFRGFASDVVFDPVDVFVFREKVK